jgi:VanZ family protein
MVIIFYFSSRQTTGIGTNATDRFYILKTFHLIEYATLAVLLFFGYKKYKYSIITAYLYALTDEFHQTFIPGRTGRFRDTLIDLLGITIGLLVLNKLLKLKFFKKIFQPEL